MISNSIISNIVENSPVSVIVTDDKSNIIYVNKKMIDLTGYSKDELIGNNPNILQSGKQHKSFYKKMWKTLSSGHEWSGTFINKKKTGELYWEKAVISPIFDIDNSITYYVGIKEDITNQINMEFELSNKIKFLNKIDDTLTHIIYVYNLKNKMYTYVNKEIYHVTGYKPKDIINRTDILSILIDDNYQKDVYEHYDLIKHTHKDKNGRIYELDYKVKTKSNKSIWVRSRDTVFEYDKNGYPLLVLGSSVDISENKKKEEDLSLLNLNKDKLFSIISHDLRGPFQTILGYVNILREEFDELSNVEIKSIIGDLYLSSKSVYDLMNNLLYWSRIQRNIISFNPVPINLYEFCEDIKKLNDFMSQSKNITLINDVDLDIVIMADENMLSSIYHNLINNSLKFTNMGGNIKLCSEKHDDNVTLIVSDDGIGLTKDNIDKILNYNSHFTIKGTNSELGSGLGLILVKEFLLYHKSMLNIESIVNSGSKFYFTLPLFK